MWSDLDVKSFFFRLDYVLAFDLKIKVISRSHGIFQSETICFNIWTNEVSIEKCDSALEWPSGQNHELNFCKIHFERINLPFCHLVFHHYLTNFKKISWINKLSWLLWNFCHILNIHNSYYKFNIFPILAYFCNYLSNKSKDVVSKKFYFLLIIKKWYVFSYLYVYNRVYFCLDIPSSSYMFASIKIGPLHLKQTWCY